MSGMCVAYGSLGVKNTDYVDIDINTASKIIG